MKKQILNLGKALHKADQKDIFGGDMEPDPIFDDGVGGGGGGTGSGGSTCNSYSSCTPGKCFSRVSCRCVLGMEGSDGYCIS